MMNHQVVSVWAYVGPTVNEQGRFKSCDLDHPASSEVIAEEDR